MAVETETRADFVAENLPLVHSLCKRFVGRGVEYDDLFAAGSLGLVKATDGFDEGRGLCFSTYAVPVILGEIKRLFRDGGAVHYSRSLQERMAKIAQISRQLSTDRAPSIGELAAACELTREEVSEALQAAQPVLSLTRENPDGQDEWDLPVDSEESRICDRLSLRAALDTLSAEDRKLVQLRYFHGLTQSRTAALLQKTQVQVSRAERRILKTIRATLGDD